MDHADTAETGHGDRHFAFSNGIHCRTDEGDIQFDIAGEVAGNIRVMGQKIRILHHQGDVVKSEPFERERRHKFVDVTHDKMIPSFFSLKLLYSFCIKYTPISNFSTGNCNFSADIRQPDKDWLSDGKKQRRPEYPPDGAAWHSAKNFTLNSRCFSHPASWH